jgi:hypothetical protein
VSVLDLVSSIGSQTCNGTRMNQSKGGRIAVAAAIGFIAGGILGQVVGLTIRSDNLPFLIAFGAVVGMCLGLAIGSTFNWWRGA